MHSQEEILNQRLNKIYSWVLANGFNLIPGGGSGLSKSLIGKKGEKIFTFYYKDGKKRKYRGEMYAYITEEKYLGGAIERNAFVN